MSAGMTGFYGVAQRLLTDHPTRWPMFHDESTVLQGSPLTRTASTAQKYEVYSAQNPAALGDRFCNAFWLRAGLYTFNVLGISGPSAGIVQWAIDDQTVVAAQDWYGATTTYNVIRSSPLVIRTSGPHILRGQVIGRNASASDYALYLTKLYFVPTIQEVW